MAGSEPFDALRSIEIALRLLVRDVLGASKWLNSQGAPDESELERRKSEEQRRRDGVVVSSQLLDYTEIFHLTGLIVKNWDQFKPALDDKRRTETFFGIINDVRNNIAHSRDLAPFEKDLLSGISGLLRSQIALYRSSEGRSSRYYPLIESVKDNFDIEGRWSEPEFLKVRPRLEVGYVLSFAGNAFAARGKPVQWIITKDHYSDASDEVVAEGDSVSFQYEVTEADVSERLTLIVRITTSSRYHRYMDGYPYPHDDHREFFYAVNPPDEDQ